MITLYSFGPAFGVADPSSFVLKIDAYLRFTGIPFATVAGAEYLRRAPKGKLPFIEDDGEIIADSYFILEHLQKKYSPDIDNHLSDKDRATAHLMMRSLDENFYWLIVYSRWMRDDTWPIINKQFFGGMSFPLKQIIPNILRRNVKKNLNGQGFGRHKETELLQILDHSLNSLSIFLGDQPYFFGDKVSSFDATAYSTLASLITVDIHNPFNEAARKHPNLVDYCKRIEQQYYVS